MDGGAIRALKLFEDICGGNFLQNSAVITTMWDKYPGSREEHIKREQELMNEYWHNCLKVRLGQKDTRLVDELASGEEINLGPGSWGTHPGVVGGAMYMRSDNKKSTFNCIIRRIIKKNPGMPQLQRELEEQLSLRETTAGKGLHEARIQAQKKKEKINLRPISRIGEELPPREIAAEMSPNRPPEGMQAPIEGVNNLHTASQTTKRGPGKPILPEGLGEESSLNEKLVRKEPNTAPPTPTHDKHHMHDRRPSEIGRQPGEELPPSETAAGPRLKRQHEKIENLKCRKHSHRSSHAEQTAHSNGERETVSEGEETPAQTAEAEHERKHSGPAAKSQVRSLSALSYHSAPL